MAFCARLEATLTRVRARETSLRDIKAYFEIVQISRCTSRICPHHQRDISSHQNQYQEILYNRNKIAICCLRNWLKCDENEHIRRRWWRVEKRRFQAAAGKGTRRNDRVWYDVLNRVVHLHFAHNNFKLRNLSILCKYTRVETYCQKCKHKKIIINQTIAREEKRATRYLRAQDKRARKTKSTRKICQPKFSTWNCKCARSRGEMMYISKDKPREREREKQRNQSSRVSNCRRKEVKLKFQI